MPVVYMSVSYPNMIHDDWLFLGDVSHSRSAEVVNNLGITHVVNACNMPRSNWFEYRENKPVKYFTVSVDDDVDVDISRFFEEAHAFISAARRESADHKVLVHCMAGVSRSTSLLLYFMMREHDWPLQQCFAWVKERRRIVAPNPSFRDQLLEAERKLRGSNSFTREEFMRMSPW